MSLSKSWVIRNLERSDSVNKKGKCFFNFFRKVSQENPNASILWANIFCVSYKKSNPSKIDSESVFANIKKISLKNNEKVKKILYFYCNWANMTKYSLKLNLS